MNINLTKFINTCSSYYIVSILLSMIVIFHGGYRIMNLNTFLKQWNTKVFDLTKQVKEKNTQAITVYQYKNQILNLQDKLTKLNNSLLVIEKPNQLLVIISATGVKSGLHFNLLKNFPIQQHSFYKILPIQLNLIGNYYQLINFLKLLLAHQLIYQIRDFEIKKLTNKILSINLKLCMYYDFKVF